VHPGRIVRTLVMAALAVGAIGGCAREVYSPPARYAPLESPDTLRSRELGVQLLRGGQDRLFGPGVGYGGLRVQYGVTDEIELAASGSYGFVTVNESDAKVLVNQGIGSGRVGAKFAPRAGRDAWALFGGVGAGAHAAGTYAAQDFGFVAGIPNRIVVPYGGWSFFVSEPLMARSVNVALWDEPDDWRRPELTVGNVLTLGARGWILNRDRGDSTDVELFAELNATNLRDHAERAGFLGGTLGLRTRLAPFGEDARAP
jgi:hypothetical protein